MCLIACALDAHPTYQLVLLANRDEAFQRPTEAMAWWSAPDILAGRDLQAGGTWLALDRRGRLCAVTNVRQVPPSQGVKSRGRLPLDFVSSDTTAPQFSSAIAAYAAEIGAFSALCWDGETLHCTSNRYGSQPVARGLHALSNAEFDAPWPKSQRLCAALEVALRDDELETTSLLELLADRHQAPDGQLPHTGVGLELERMLSPIFIANNDVYGSRASTVVTISYEGHVRVSERSYGPRGRQLGELSFEFTVADAASKAGDFPTR